MKYLDNLIFQFLSAFLFFEFIIGKEICYKDYGCFTDEFPYGGSSQRPIGALPQDPNQINTTFILYNRNISDGEIITANDLGTRFDSSLPIKFITHRYLSKPVEQWMLDMKDALLNGA